MGMKNLEVNVLAPGYAIIVAGSLLENFAFGCTWFKLGSVFGVLWLLAGLVMLFFARRELKKGEGFMLVQSGLFSRTRNPSIAAHLLGIMPGLCLLLSTNLGILGIITTVLLFYRYIDTEEMELEERFGEHYEVYRERVNRILPCNCAE